MDTQAEEQPGNRPASGYWFTPLPVYLLDAAIDPDSPVNGSAVVLWAHLHRHYAWRKRVFPSYATLGRETDQSESAVKRQLKALKEVGALDWGANYGPKGRSSNEYALAPQRPFVFDRETAVAVEVKNDLHRPVGVKSDLGVPFKNDRHPQVKNDLGVKSTEDLEISLVPPAPPDAPEPPAAPVEEREILAKAINDDTAKVVAAWLAARGGRRNPKAEKRVRESAASLLAVGRSIPDVIAIAEDMAVNYPTGSDLAIHDDHFTAQQRASPSRLPDWCGCGGNPAAEFNGRFRTHDGTAKGQPCLICHPDAMQESA